MRGVGGVRGDSAYGWRIMAGLSIAIVVAVLCAVCYPFVPFGATWSPPDEFSRHLRQVMWTIPLIVAGVLLVGVPLAAALVGWNHVRGRPYEQNAWVVGLIAGVVIGLWIAWPLLPGIVICSTITAIVAARMAPRLAAHRRVTLALAAGVAGSFCLIIGGDYYTALA